VAAVPGDVSPTPQKKNPYGKTYVLIHLNSHTNFMSVREPGWTAQFVAFASEEVSLLFKPRMDAIKKRKEG
jgi:hypothetical protein